MYNIGCILFWGLVSFIDPYLCKHTTTVAQQYIFYLVEQVQPSSLAFLSNLSLLFLCDAEAEVSIRWPPDVKSWPIRKIGKSFPAGKDWRQEEKGMTEDKMVVLHHQFNRHEFEQTLGDGEGQRSLVCCGPWGGRVGHDWATKQQQQQVLTSVFRKLKF